ncbi:hypothetical protein FKM82_024318 [Ascaphus truei]
MGRKHVIRRRRSPVPSSPAHSAAPRSNCHVVSGKTRTPKKSKAASEWRERRNAIRLTEEHTVETLVVADADMVQYHGADAAQRFILTVMNMVRTPT